MDVKEFVSKTLLQIVEGVQEAISQNPTNARINPSNSFAHALKQVEFDVAITATDERDASGGIKVGGIGADLQSKSRDGSVSRIKFTVPVVLPSGEAGDS